MRIRYIKPGYFNNEVLCGLHPLTRILFAGLWCAADKEGRLEDRPARLKATLLPFDDHDVDAALRDLERAGFIVRYDNDGQRLISILTWSSHQKPHRNEPASIIPPPSERKKPTRSRVARTPRTHGEWGMGNGEWGMGNGEKDSPQLALGPPVEGLPPTDPQELLSTSEAPGPQATNPPPSEESRTPPEPKPQEVIYRYWEKRLRKPHLEKLPPRAWSILGARLKEGMTVEMGCAVVDGAVLDAERWPDRQTNDGIPYLFGSMELVLKFADLAVKGNPKPVVDLEKIRRGNQRAEDQGWENVEKRPVDRKKAIP